MVGVRSVNGGKTLDLMTQGREPGGVNGADTPQRAQRKSEPTAASMARAHSTFSLSLKKEPAKLL